MATLEQRKKRMGLSALVVVVGAPDYSSTATSPVDKLTESGRFVIGDFIIARDGNVEERPPRGLSRLGGGNGAAGAAPPTGALGAPSGGAPAGLGRVPHNLPPANKRAASVGGVSSSAASRLTAAGPGGEPLDWSKLQIGEMLGRGASGYVRRARLGKQDLAVKRIAISDEERRQQTFNEISALVGVSDLGAANLATCYGERARGWGGPRSRDAGKRDRARVGASVHPRAYIVAAAGRPLNHRRCRLAQCTTPR